jgi:tetrahydromethanopterin S-methyltransferase subunit C
MLPPIVTKSFGHVTSAVISFAIIMVAGAFVAVLLARSFGGKSPIKRQAIFSIISFGSLCAAAYYAMSRLSGGG